MNPVVRTRVPPPSPENSSVRRVVLPSGKEIEVVRFDAPATTPSASWALHVCPECEGDHMQPVDWQEVGRDHWDLELHCPNCGWEGGGVFAQDAVECFEDQLHRATRALVVDLRRLQRARMEDDVERFSAALAGDHILPEDF